jgi:hypothetical protein
MMKLRTGRTVILGLSHANLDRLRADGLQGAIRVLGNDIGADIDIFITAAETEQAMLEAFQDNIGPETKVNIDKRLKS